MRRHPFVRIAVALSVLALAGGCSKQTTVPEGQKTCGAQQRMEPVTVTGCLRSGMAQGTYVLNAMQPQGSGNRANYPLHRAQGVDLRQYDGQPGRVCGTARAGQR